VRQKRSCYRSQLLLVGFLSRQTDRPGHALSLFELHVETCRARIETVTDTKPPPELASGSLSYQDSASLSTLWRQELAPLVSSVRSGLLWIREEQIRGVDPSETIGKPSPRIELGFQLYESRVLPLIRRGLKWARAFVGNHPSYFPELGRI